MAGGIGDAAGDRSQHRLRRAPRRRPGGDADCRQRDDQRAIGQGVERERGRDTGQADDDAGDRRADEPRNIE